MTLLESAGRGRHTDTGASPLLPPLHCGLGRVTQARCSSVSSSAKGTMLVPVLVAAEDVSPGREGLCAELSTHRGPVLLLLRLLFLEAAGRELLEGRSEVGEAGGQWGS